ncbi:hypothetical protein [Scytonema sp. HK-05]|uniref:hypothetical protein n=1 Tax=Scytonema sp. HK-05 TaxID=1137095 RepID=UPI000935A88F|nr:hypothetical protein [Scytonema sp. HK-05]OKH57215.1 hypothetical protein NIES2130_21215 [Scytonema sp. HK-05]
MDQVTSICYFLNSNKKYFIKQENYSYISQVIPIFIEVLEESDRGRVATCDCCLTPPSSRYHETAVEHKRAGGKI